MDVLIGEALALVCTHNDVHIIAVIQVKCKCIVEVLELELLLSDVSLSVCSSLHYRQLSNLYLCDYSDDLQSVHEIAVPISQEPQHGW